MHQDAQVIKGEKPGHEQMSRKSAINVRVPQKKTLLTLGKQIPHVGFNPHPPLLVTDFVWLWCGYKLNSSLSESFCLT